MVVAPATPDYGLLFIVGVLGWTIATAIFLPLWLRERRKAKKGKSQTGTMLVGLRASSRGARLRTVEAKRGAYTWKEKDDFEADVYLDGAFHYDVRSDDFNGTLVLVDLDSFHPIRLETTQTTPLPVPNLVAGAGAVGVAAGATVPAAASLSYMGRCVNDDEETTIWGRDGQSLGKVKGIWRRLPGDRLAKIRKDLRILQIHAIMSAWWTTLTKFVPVAIIILGVLMLALMGMVGWGMFHHGG